MPWRSGWGFRGASSDPATLVTSAATLTAVAFAAGALPAWRVGRVDPMRTFAGGVRLRR